MMGAVLSEYGRLIGRPANLQDEHLQALADEIWSRRPCRLLVFGLGEDSRFWTLLNSCGHTLFLEDDAEWFNKVDLPNKVLVTYTTVRDVESSPEPLVEACGQWDLIIVDAPRAFDPETPGRQQSILTAATVRGPRTVVFVHDFERGHERFWCDRYLGEPTEVIGGRNSLAVWRR